ncbi:MAG: ATP-binding protein, partial [Pseudomonadota bacterium]|nr:ATP-binding protein [Pseudomonadota bacterium]
TTRAKVLAFKYRDAGVVEPDAKIGFVDVPKLIGEYVGHSEKRLSEFIDKVGKGVIILDELDSLLEVHSFGRNLLNFVNDHMGNSVNQPVFVATAYDWRQDELLGASDGLRRRFRHIIASPNFGLEDLTQMFAKKCEAVGLAYEPMALVMVQDLLTDAQNLLKKKFAHAGEVKNIFDTVIEVHGERLGRSGVKFERFKPEDLKTPAAKAVMTITVDDIPRLNEETGTYRPPFETYERPSALPKANPPSYGKS